VSRTPGARVVDTPTVVAPAAHVRARADTRCVLFGRRRGYDGDVVSAGGITHAMRATPVGGLHRGEVGRSKFTTRATGRHRRRIERNLERIRWVYGENSDRLSYDDET